MREIGQHVPWGGLAVAARLSGLEYKRPELQGQSSDQWLHLWKDLESLVETADAFIVADGAVLTEFSERLKKRVADGARVLVIPDINCLSQMNAFLSSFGLAATPYRILPDASDSTVLTIPRLLECYLDRDLLDAVDSVTFTSVTAVRFERDAIPVLLASEKSWAVDATSDFPIKWNRLELACIARWEGPSGGAVVVIGGDIFWDTSRRWTDLSLMPGIQHNGRLSANLLRYAAKIAAVTVSPAQHCERAEQNLATFVLTKLQLHFGQEWWAEGVPLNIRQECAKRQEEEVRRKFPKEAYLNLIDLKTIMEKNWNLFLQHFKKPGETQGKDKALSWLDKFNELRRLTAHPLKTHIAEYSMSPEESEFARDVDERALFLINSLPQHS
jgi:hypothetical protein